MVHGYHELHNSWPFHNGAAPGCGRADGMSFSPFAAEKTILVPILSPHDTLFPSLSRGDLFFASQRLIQGLRAVCRLHKVIILRSLRGRARAGWGGPQLETHFE